MDKIKVRLDSGNLAVYEDVPERYREDPVGVRRYGRLVAVGHPDGRWFKGTLYGPPLSILSCSLLDALPLLSQ